MPLMTITVEIDPDAYARLYGSLLVANNRYSAPENAPENIIIPAEQPEEEPAIVVPEQPKPLEPVAVLFGEDPNVLSPPSPPPLVEEVLGNAFMTFLRTATRELEERRRSPR